MTLPNGAQPSAQLQQARSLLTQGLYADALSLYQVLLDDESFVARAGPGAIQCLFRLGRHDELEELYKAIQPRIPGEQSICHYLGFSYEFQERWRAALDHWLDCIDQFGAGFTCCAHGLRSAISIPDLEAAARIFDAARSGFLIDDSVSLDHKRGFCQRYLDRLLASGDPADIPDVLVTASKFFSELKDYRIHRRYLDTLPDDLSRMRAWQQLINAGCFRIDTGSGEPRSPLRGAHAEIVDSIVAGELREVPSGELESAVVHRIEAEEDGDFEPPRHASHYYMYRVLRDGSRPEIGIYAFDNCYLTVDVTAEYRSQYYLFDSCGRYIPALSSGVSPCMGDVRSVDENVALCDDRFASTQLNICHVLLDGVTRARCFSTLPIDSYLFLGASGYLDQVARLLGMRLTDIRALEQSRIVTFRLRRLYVADSSTINQRHPAHNMSEFSMQKLFALKEKIESTAFGPGDSYPRRLYIDRQGARNRRVLNSDPLDAALAERGIKSVRLEGYSMMEQARLFNRAELVVGVHGAGLTNIVFCRPGTRVIEMLPAFCASSSYWKLARAMKLDYDALVLDDPGYDRPDYSTWEHDVRWNSRDVVVPVDDLHKVLDRSC